MKYTPSDIVKNNRAFSIPIYQRLFEWESDNINALLEDLRKSFIVSHGNHDYYIGMLTSTKDNELVDGQQRFTVMMLLGSILQNYCSEWKEFVSGDKQRLYFASRPTDNAYLRNLIDGNENQKIENLKMKRGYDTIKTFFENKDLVPEIDRKDFASYIFNHLCFFISELPAGYSPRDLNKYFERMNTSGKNLEQHEILKVKLLSNIESNIDYYMVLWNKLSDVDTILIKKRNDETEESFESRKKQAISSNIKTISEQKLINGLVVEDDVDSFSIVSVEPSSIAPKTERESSKNSSAALTFPYLLLQTLYRMLKGKIDCSIEDFFRPSNLLDIFSHYLPYEGDSVDKNNIENFMELLVKSRLALDICFIRPTEYGYSLDLNINEDDENLQKLLMLQSMIFVSSSNYTNYKWFGWLMDVVEKNGIPDVEYMYNYFKTKDEENRWPINYVNLSYGEIRYWFWKLDFYIWLNRKEIFKGNLEALNVANNYVFKRNRSIEHIAPQTPQSVSRFQWDGTEADKTLRNSFGNLVMISQGLNSSLSNESYEIKKAHVEAYCKGSKSGSIESLKLLVVFCKYKEWNRENIETHGQEMYEWLEKSFK